jgi:signal transduction histidine kinase
MKTVQEQVVGAEELAKIFRDFNEATRRLEESHTLLQQRVEELQRELAEKNEELARKKRLAALGEMAAAVAHEIRNPLGGIGLCAGLLRREVSDERNGLLVEKIVVGVRNLNEVVESMLAFTRNIALNRVECSLNEILRGALASLAPEIEKSRTAVNVVAPGEIGASVDAALLATAFSNIVRNAIQAMGDGGRLDVRLTPRSDGSAEISFKDSGPGIAEDVIEKIFNPFFTGREGGTGLGLAIVHRIVEAHGARIIAENSSEGGAVFTISLPPERSD